MGTAPPPHTHRRGLQRRLTVTLAALVSSVAAAVLVSLAFHARVHDASDDVRRAEGALVAVLRVSIAVREAWAHQAHMVILNDRSHATHYRDAVEAMARATDLAENAVSASPATAALLARVSEEARLLDAQFVADVLPLVGGARDALGAPAEVAIFRVARMQTAIDEAATLLARDIATAHARVDEASAHSSLAGGLVLAISVVVALASAVSLRRSLAAPLARLEAATERLARGELDARIDAQLAARPDELGSLAARFNVMAGALAEREQKLLDAERLAAVGRLAAGVAHEINNPLGVILGTARLLEHKQDEAGRRDVHTIVGEVERCRVIVGGLLDMSRPLTLERATHDVRALTQDTLDRVGSAVSTRLTLESSGDAAARVDADKLRQVLTNLLLNAHQAGARAVSVRVDGSARERVQIDVLDDGPGVGPSLAPRLFEPFVTGRADGTGLGLALSRTIARAHGGDLELVPSSRGAHFRCTLPRAAREEHA